MADVAPSPTRRAGTKDTEKVQGKAVPRARRVPASDGVRAEWGRRIEAEYRSAAITQHLTLWLIQIGASPDLIDDGLRIVKDELTHAQLSHRTFVAAGGQVPPPLARETLGLRAPAGEALELSVARTGVEVFCLGETVAVPLFKVLREGCTVPVARRALDRVLRDEVRHRDFGWALLRYMLESPSGGAVRALVVRELPRMLARVRRGYMPPGAEAKATLPEEDRAWGLMPWARYGQILERTITRDYVPRFGEHGIDAGAAWAEATGR
ncbi:ferritin-like domain-containing protein [Chondromyces apiculatus]|uniref:PE-PGRS family protein n=1 Tax=Chondromyces apiculatus DSM 436 TaxID=1192034 RepID=A0A017THS2_9BACT|nr:ferritin-like domain-containing protein [Chondromyces apiculatus]EYF08442.1 PE-PGRS family protein [Chondromyces apiculatus DSM 436]